VARAGVDGTATLQKALNQCISPSGGCTVQLSAGTYVTKQLYTQNFNGTIEGMGIDKTSIEACAPLPVSQAIPVWSDVPTLGPELIQFEDGDISISDLAIRFTAPVATTEWFDDVWGEVHELVCVLRVTGQSANLSLNRVKMEGGFADELDPWARLDADYTVVQQHYQDQLAWHSLEPSPLGSYADCVQVCCRTQRHHGRTNLRN
jgi:hypothetical protein